MKAEDIKAGDSKKIRKELNELIKKRSSILCDGHLVPMGKPGKDPKEPASYRPVTLLSVYRKILSAVIFGRIDEQLERALAGTQYTYRNN